MDKFLNLPNHGRRVVGKARRTRSALKQRLSAESNYHFNMDSPRKKTLESRTIQVEGWIIPKDSKDFKLRVKNNDSIHAVKMGLKRPDVMKAHPELDHDKALKSGFRSEFDFEDGDIIVEVNSGRGYKQLYKASVQFGVERLPSTIYNKNLSNYYPEHVNLLDNRQKIYYENRLKNSYERAPEDPRLVAIYLPQFHPFEENNKAWGLGFTEWANVTAGQPRFIGHQQPILPKDLGFYDLRVEGKLKEQIDLAKKYGIYGFSFYYYWFSGKKLMDGPIESIISHKEWDFNFTICWANENWTKRWDGRDSDVIIAQEYNEDDPLNFIKDVEHILTDERYITEDGKPVLMVYRASELKDPARYAAIWREYFREKHNKELQLVSCLSFEDQDPREYGFDAAQDFAPLSAFFKNSMFPKNQFPYIDVSQKLLDTNFSGVVADYRSIATNPKLDNAYRFPLYPCVTPSWDNDARKKGKGFVYQNSSPDIYAQWLQRVITDASSKSKAPLIYINAWNEWAEGAILEPSVHLGHATLNRTVEALAISSGNKTNITHFPQYGLVRTPKTKLAVIVHLFYTDLWSDIQKRLEFIQQDFDIFITLNERDSNFQIEPFGSAKKVHTYVLPNRGRDVLPFLYVLRRVEAAGYEHLLKIHSKKSKHRNDGSSWFTEVLDSLLPGAGQISTIVERLDEVTTGLIGPAGHLVSLKRHMGSNWPILGHLLRRMYPPAKVDNIANKPEAFPYFGGTMFWARVDLFHEILNLQLLPDDFQSEHGQIDGTSAHAIERLIGVICRVDGREMYESSDKAVTKVGAEDHHGKYKYAP